MIAETIKEDFFRASTLNVQIVCKMRRQTQSPTGKPQWHELIDEYEFNCQTYAKTAYSSSLLFEIKNSEYSDDMGRRVNIYDDELFEIIDVISFIGQRLSGDTLIRRVKLENGLEEFRIDQNELKVSKKKIDFRYGSIGLIPAIVKKKDVHNIETQEKGVMFIINKDIFKAFISLKELRFLLNKLSQLDLQLRSSLLVSNYMTFKLMQVEEKVTKKDPVKIKNEAAFRVIPERKINQESPERQEVPGIIDTTRHIKKEDPFMGLG